MQIDWTTLALQTINAVILVWLLARFLFRPVALMIAKRQAAAQALIDDAAAAKRAAETERDAARDATAQIEANRAAALHTIDTEAAARRTALLDAAQAEADRLRTVAAAERAREAAAQAHAASGALARLAAGIAGRLLDRLPPEARVAGFADGIADGLRSLPETVRAELGAHDSPIGLVAARDLLPAERTVCEAAFSAALGRTVAITVSVDTELIAGFVLETPHAIVRNNFRDDLASILAELETSPDDSAA